MDRGAWPGVAFWGRTEADTTEWLTDTHIADSLCCTAGSNTTMWSNHQKRECESFSHKGGFFTTWASREDHNGILLSHEKEQHNAICIILTHRKGLIGKDPAAGKDWRREEKGATEDEMVDGIADSMDISLGKPWELVMGMEAWRAAVHEVVKSRTRLSYWIKCHLHQRGQT